MLNPNRFYTYAYLREDRTPYYIGKGQTRRIYQQDGKPCNVPKDRSRIIFLKRNLTEREAFKHEIYMIAVFGRKDNGTGILRNRSNGGEGGGGRIISEEMKQRLREINLGKKYSEETKAKLRKIKGGKNHPLYGKKHSQETKKLQSQIKLGKNNPFYGKKHNQEWKDMILSIKCIYEYEIMSPSGKTFIVENLAKFCRENDLHNGAMCLVSDGKRTHHKNWKVVKKLREKGG
jgi:group I intron endonuclease